MAVRPCLHGAREVVLTSLLWLVGEMGISEMHVPEEGRRAV